MNFVKRRWPDLLIVLLVLLLLLGFASLLLGKSPASLTGTSTSQPATTEPTSSAPSPATGSSTQGTSSAPTSSQSSTATTTPTTTTPPTTSTTSAAPSGQPTTAAPSNGTNSTPAPAGDQSQNAGDQTSGSAAVPTIPAGPIGTDTSTNNTPPAATPTTPAPTPSTTPPPATTTPTLTPRAGGSVSTSETRVPTRNDYRISLGTFSSTAAVQAATADVSRLGYTVYPITVASGAVAQVGPFATREQANQALADIQRAMPSALLYPPRNAPASDSGSSSSSSASSSTASTSQSSASAQSTPAAAPDSPVYLQVGAYNTVDAAQATVSKMRDLGYDPTVNAPAGRKVTVLVGPFRGDALLRTERRLDANGQDHFRVR
ncbi:SPOR domain-containing protein [Deinococcus sp. KNUC1210]|uniref:SPOR domain-containing protein n=1 Tax=Deinococcus sp. KNUC1210 TaxID=2917691 RepID=UPI001EF024E8|nr:SPOR domain-containing protein [Deinococcus sp. KNUC1210]ULH15692.1 SPOR domain-containing protein [Deinococcus sp. KNUC1210]